MPVRTIRVGEALKRRDVTRVRAPKSRQRAFRRSPLRHFLRSDLTRLQPDTRIFSRRAESRRRPTSVSEFQADQLREAFYNRMNRFRADRLLRIMLIRAEYDFICFVRVFLRPLWQACLERWTHLFISFQFEAPCSDLVPTLRKDGMRSKDETCAISSSER